MHLQLCISEFAGIFYDFVIKLEQNYKAKIYKFRPADDPLEFFARFLIFHIVIGIVPYLITRRLILINARTNLVPI